MFRFTNVETVFLPPLGQLPSLKNLYVASMDNVKEVGSKLLGNEPEAFPSLEILRFVNMPRWEVWSVKAVGVAAFPCLKELDISDCPNMERWEVSSANADVGVFPCLKKLWIVKCPNLVNVSLETLPSLRNLEVWKCGDVLLTSLVGVASSITKLSIAGISGLGDEMWGGVVQYLGEVEELEIQACNEIRNLWDITRCDKLVRIGGGGEKGEDEVGSNLPKSLRMLTIGDCKNLKHLSCPGSIETLKIWDCENLEHLSCPANSIEKLGIWNCSSITSVSFPTEGGGGWQKLKSLYITRCNSVLEEELEKQVLITVNNNTNIPPMLQALYIVGWVNLKSITKFTCLIHLMKLEIKYCGRIESFPDLQDLVLLKHLKITDCRSMDGPPPLRRSGGVNGVWPPKLDSLEIGWLKRPISEWGPLPTSLVELTLYGGGSSSAEEDVKSFPTSLLIPSSSSLSKLDLSGFEKMERISSEGLQHLTSLQHLVIYKCPKMKDLQEPLLLLPSLLSLEIHYCNEELKDKMMSRRGSYWSLLSRIPKVYISSGY